MSFMNRLFNNEKKERSAQVAEALDKCVHDQDMACLSNGNGSVMFVHLPY